MALGSLRPFGMQISWMEGLVFLPSKVKYTIVRRPKDNISDIVFELEFKISDLFPKKEEGIYCNDLIFRISLNSTEEKFHIPVIISRHGASTWWSGE